MCGESEREREKPWHTVLWKWLRSPEALAGPSFPRPEALLAYLPPGLSSTLGLGFRVEGLGFRAILLFQCFFWGFNPEAVALHS